MWALGHQHLYTGAAIKTDLTGRGAAQHTRGPSPLPLRVLLYAQACLFLKGITRRRDYILVPNWRWDMDLFLDLC